MTRSDVDEQQWCTAGKGRVWRLMQGLQASPRPSAMSFSGNRRAVSRHRCPCQPKLFDVLRCTGCKGWALQCRRAGHPGLRLQLAELRALKLMWIMKSLWIRIVYRKWIHAVGKSCLRCMSYHVCNQKLSLIICSSAQPQAVSTALSDRCQMSPVTRGRAEPARSSYELGAIL